MTTLGHGPSQVDSSQLAKLLEPWWCWLANRLPEHLAPNTITLLGVACLVVPTVALFAAWSLELPLPWWLFALQIVGVFAFQTLDALDGKQARRTHRSSPAGSWLDHACDIGTTHFMILGVAIATGAITSPIGLLAVWGALWAGVLLYWEATHTGRVHLGNGGSITEVQCMSMLLHGLAIVLGTEGMRVPIVDRVDALGFLGPVAALGTGTFIVLVGALVPMVIATTYAFRGVLSVQGPTRWSALAPLLVAGGFAYVLFDWVGSPQGRLALLLALGAQGTFLVTTLILDTLYDRRATIDGPGAAMLAPLALVALVWPAAPALVLTVVVAAMLWAVVITRIIVHARAMARALGIRLFADAGDISASRNRKAGAS